MRGGNKEGYAVVHMMKIKTGAVGGIQSHNNREHEPKTNPDVDMSRSGDN
ncbi:plasmid recombination protein [Clostridioides difficile]